MSLTRRAVVTTLVLSAGAMRNTGAVAADPPVVTDLVYGGAADTDLTASYYRPAGAGPFPLLVYVHGGAWTAGDRSSVDPIARALATQGIGSLSIDFRMPPQYPYPESIADISLALRFVKANAVRFDTHAEWVGLIGESSGAHQAVLLAMRPTDPRYNIHGTQAGATDSRVGYVVSLWGVLDPLARYRAAVARGNANLVRSHLAYWRDEAAMAEGNPQLILDRRETMERPAILAIYGTGDQNVDFQIPRRFVASYRAYGGVVEALEFAGAAHGFIRPPFDSASRTALGQIGRFVLTQARRSAGFG